MPVYDYLCPECGPITAFRSMADHDKTLCCPVCSSEAPRAFLQAPNLSCMPGSSLKAHERNETAQNAPVYSSKDRREVEAREGSKAAHPAGCSCCSGGFRSSAVYRPDGSKTFPSKRPWMISH